MCEQFENALRHYLAAFDGTNNISDPEFQARFDNLHHQDCVLIPLKGGEIEQTFKFMCQDGPVIARKDLFDIESAALGYGTKVTLVHCRKIGLNTYDIKLRYDSHKGVSVYRFEEKISSGKVISMKEVDESALMKFLENKLSTMLHKMREVGPV